MTIADVFGSPEDALRAGEGIRNLAGRVLPVLSFGLKAQYRGASLLNYDSQGDTSYLSMLTFAGNVTERF